MQTLATILSITSGFGLIGYHEGLDRMIATSLAVDASLAPLTAVIASRRGRSVLFWIIAGFGLGMWALAYVLLFTPRHGRPSDSQYPPTSDAA
jgi:type IV secretory pathway TrbD component